MAEKRSWIPEEIVAEVRELDLLTYLERYEPYELVRLSANVYSTRTNDSLKISNGKWYRWSRRVGGRSALDYLEKVRGMDFYSAVEHIYALLNRAPPPRASFHDSLSTPDITHPKRDKPANHFELPLPNTNNERVIRYLTGRCIHPDVLAACIASGLLYEDTEHHNAVFVGHDDYGTPRYAFKRGTWDAPTEKRKLYKGEASGSDKQFSFALKATEFSRKLIVTEAPIDALSVASLMRMRGEDWRETHILSLGGVSAPRDKDHGGTNTAHKPPSYLPVALDHYLHSNDEIKRITICLDNDKTGRGAAESIMSQLADMERDYQLEDKPPPKGKDYNEYLQIKCRSRNRAAFLR